jgi:hypothetical protein
MRDITAGISEPDRQQDRVTLRQERRCHPAALEFACALARHDVEALLANFRRRC